MTGNGKKVQVEFSGTFIKRINAMMEELGIKTKKELFNSALTLLEWAIQERKQGKTLCSLDEKDKTITKVFMPVLTGVDL